jgi:hypothetical protein
MFGSNDGYDVLPNIAPVLASATTAINHSGLYCSYTSAAVLSKKN